MDAFRRMACSEAFSFCAVEGNTPWVPWRINEITNLAHFSGCSRDGDLFERIRLYACSGNWTSPDTRSRAHARG